MGQIQLHDPSIVERTIQAVTTRWPDSTPGQQQFISVITGMMTRDQKLQKCDAASVVLCLVECALLGLTPSPTQQLAHVIPYGNKATLVIGYKGLIELARRSGAVTRVQAHEFYENDHFEHVLGTDTHLKHIPWQQVGAESSGELRGAYCIAHLRDIDEPMVEVMYRDDIEAIRAKVRGGGPWNEHTAMMYRKTVVRRAAKMWPQTPFLARGLEVSDRGDMGETNQFAGQETFSRSVGHMDTPGIVATAAKIAPEPECEGAES